MEMAEMDEVFKALADPTRRVMVERLSQGPASVSELARPLPMSLPAVVQHLHVLEASGLVRYHGLPDGPYYPVVLRDAMCTDDRDPDGVYFGTRSGEVFATNDEGASWTTVVAHLPDVLSVRAVSV